MKPLLVKIAAGGFAALACSGVAFADAPNAATPDAVALSVPTPGAVAPSTDAQIAIAPTPVTIEACIYAAASVYHEPPAVLVILLNVEGGTLGAVSHNTNGTVDIGPMQVNQLWIPKLAQHWRADPQTTYEALRDNFCANVEAGAWILRQGLDRANGDFWGGVAYYHSFDPVYQDRYLRSVLAQALRLETMAKLQTAPSAVGATPIPVSGGG